MTSGERSLSDSLDRRLGTGRERTTRPRDAAAVFRFAGELTSCSNEEELAHLVIDQLALLFDAPVTAAFFMTPGSDISLARVAGVPGPIALASIPALALDALRGGGIVHGTTADLEDLEELGVSVAAALAGPLPSASGDPLGALLVATAMPRAPDSDVPLFEGFASVAASGLAHLNRVGRAVLEARRDALTGLPNRRAFEEHLQVALQKAHSSDAEVTLVLLDLDDFKRVNDVYGHVVGDEVLRHFARVARDATRAIEPIFRIGGEEFALVLDVDAARGTAVAERVRRNVERQRRDRRMPTVSAGLASLRPGPADKQRLVERADAALYAAKRAGKNRVFVGGDESPP